VPTPRNTEIVSQPLVNKSTPSAQIRSFRMQMSILDGKYIFLMAIHD